MGIREAVLAGNKLREGTVDVPEWGVELAIRELDARQATEFSAMSLRVQKANEELEGAGFPIEDVCQVIAWSVFDPETGALVFSGDDLEELATGKLTPLNRVFRAITRLSYLGATGAEDASGN